MNTDNNKAAMKFTLLHVPVKKDLRYILIFSTEYLCAAETVTMEFPVLILGSTVNYFPSSSMLLPLITQHMSMFFSFCIPLVIN